MLIASREHHQHWRVQTRWSERLWMGIRFRYSQLTWYWSTCTHDSCLVVIEYNCHCFKLCSPCVQMHICPTESHMACTITGKRPGTHLETIGPASIRSMTVLGTSSVLIHVSIQAPELDRGHSEALRWLHCLNIHVNRACAYICMHLHISHARYT